MNKTQPPAGVYCPLLTTMSTEDDLVDLVSNIGAEHLQQAHPRLYSKALANRMAFRMGYDPGIAELLEDLHGVQNGTLSPPDEGSETEPNTVHERAWLWTHPPQPLVSSHQQYQSSSGLDDEWSAKLRKALGEHQRGRVNWASQQHVDQNAVASQPAEVVQTVDPGSGTVAPRKAKVWFGKEGITRIMLTDGSMWKKEENRGWVREWFGDDVD